MFRVFVILAVGLAIGYSYGFRDAQQHDRHVVTRVLDRVGGDARKYSSSDNVDATLRQAER